jgi:hypothetical protein
VSDRPQYPSYPGDHDPTRPEQPGPGEPQRYGQVPLSKGDGQQPPAPGQVPPPGYGQVPPPGYGQVPPPGYGQAPPPGYGQVPPPGYGQVPPPGYAHLPLLGYGFAPAVPTSNKAVAGMVLGIVSILFCYLGVLIGPVAVVFSVLARRDIDARLPQPMNGRGMATAGLVTGIIGTLIWAAVIALIIVGVATDA